MGSGAYCRVDMVAHHSNSSEMFAYKSIDPCRVKFPGDLITAITELANEAKILSSLDHQNIIKLRGVSSERFSESFATDGGGYFLMLDVLNETLGDRLDHWSKENKRARHTDGVLRRTQKTFTKRFKKLSTSPLSSLPNTQECQGLYDRIRDTVLGIAKGMKYLHSNNIVARDLKPANIGYENIFDGRYNEDGLLGESTVKLFDFGMAQKVDDCDPNEVCGSPRYMAPEVMAGKGYTLAVDVYSFGVILFEMCSLKRPFEETYRKRKTRTRKRPWQRATGHPVGNSFYTAVVNEQLKPSNALKRDVCCPKLRNLIETCWDHDPSKRPTFDTILTRLAEILRSDLFLDANDIDSESLQTRDFTGRRSISIEFDCSFDLSCSSRSTDRYPCP